MRLLQAERALVIIIAAIAAVDIALILVKNVALDWIGYAAPVATGLALIVASQYYRVLRREENIAVALSASGFFILFTLVASVFNYMLLPIRFAPFDLFLVEIDAMFGYSWPNAVALAADWPGVTKLLFYVYFSSLPQLAAAVLLLGLSGKSHALWHFLLTGIIGVSGCIFIWFFFPTFGPSTLYSISSDVLAKINLGVTQEYGDELTRLSKEGASYISPENVLGLIGFPSFHTVMACMSVAFLTRIWWIFPFVLLLNIVMMPAILVHGGHHLSDLFGGIVMFVVAYVLAKKLLARIATEERFKQNHSLAEPSA